MPWGPQYSEVPNTFADSLIGLANSVTAIQKRKMEEEQQKSDMAARSEQIAASQQERLRNQRAMEEEDAYKRDVSALPSGPTEQDKKNAATQSLYDNWDSVMSKPDSTSRRAAGTAAEAAGAASAKPDYVQQFAEHNKALAKYGPKAATFLAGGKDLADKQITQEGYALQREQISSDSEKNRLERQRQFDESQVEKKRQFDESQALKKEIANNKKNSSIYAGLSDEEIAALNSLMTEGRIDPYKVTSRTAKIYANMELQNPGTNFHEISTGLTAQTTAAREGAKISDRKVIGANSGMVLINKVINPKTEKITNMKAITPQFTSELALQCARVIAPNNPQVGIEMMREFKQATAQEGVSRLAAFVGVSVAGTTEENLRNIKMFLQREGSQAEVTRGKYYEGKPGGVGFNTPELTGGTGSVPLTNDSGSSFDDLWKKHGGK